MVGGGRRDDSLFGRGGEVEVGLGLGGVVVTMRWSSRMARRLPEAWRWNRMVVPMANMRVEGVNTSN